MELPDLRGTVREGAQTIDNPNPNPKDRASAGDQVQHSRDVKKDALWFHRQGLLWLKNLDNEIHDHLKHCVRHTSELTWLPQAMVHNVVATMMNFGGNCSFTLLPELAWVLPNKGDTPRVNPDDDKPGPEELKFVPEKLHHK
jgi:hypothetical protein